VHQQLEGASIVGMWLKITSTVGMWHQLVGIMIEMCIHNWNWHQLLE
jgi:hypothetical protein